MNISLGSLNDTASKTMYIELNVKMERMTKLTYFLFVQLSVPGVMFPALFITSINYFVLDLGNESLFLPFFMMSVTNYFIWK